MKFKFKKKDSLSANSIELEEAISSKVDSDFPSSLFNNVYTFFSNKNIAPSTIMNTDEYGDTINITLTIVSGLKKDDLKFLELEDDSCLGDDLPSLYYGVKITINDELVDFINVESSGDGMFYSGVACERRIYTRNFTSAVANLMYDMYRVESFRSNKKVEIKIIEEDNIKLSAYIVCTNEFCKKLHSYECYSCSNNKRAHTFNEV